MTEDRRVPGNQEVIDAVDRVLADHEDEFHAFTATQLKVMVGEHRELYDEVAPIARDTNKRIVALDEKMDLIVTEIYGRLSPTAVDPKHRDGGMIELLTEMNETILAFTKQAKNGGINTTRKWTSGQWAFYSAVATGWFILVAAVFAAVWPD